MNGSSGAKRATSVHALDQSAEIDGKKNLLALTNCVMLYLFVWIKDLYRNYATYL